jgi:uncharacterized phage protein (TIGR01671 family)
MREIKFRVWEDYRLKEIDFYWFEGRGYREMEDVPRDCILMQYTGLKDKNGKEIYEGDIYVEFFGKNASRPCVVCEISVSSWILEENKCNSPMSSVEVIGNIYENPELIK